SSVSTPASSETRARSSRYVVMSYPLPAGRLADEQDGKTCRLCCLEVEPISDDDGSLRKAHTQAQRLSDCLLNSRSGSIPGAPHGVFQLCPPNRRRTSLRRWLVDRLLPIELPDRRRKRLPENEDAIARRQPWVSADKPVDA